MDKQLLESTVSKVLDEMRLRPIPLGVSNRHIHLSAADYERLFPGHPISEKKALLQPGQYYRDGDDALRRRGRGGRRGSRSRKPVPAARRRCRLSG